MVAVTSSSAAISKWRSALTRSANELQAKYAYALPSVAGLLADVTKWWQIATEFSNTAQTMSGVTDRDVTDAQDNMLALLEFRAQLKMQPAGATVSADIRDIAVNLMTAPIVWLQRIGSPVLETQADYIELAQKVTDAPSNVVAYVLDQLRKSLGLPSWFVPVAAGTAAVGVAAWAYFTFLAPVARISKVIRQNPGRRRLRS